MVDAPNSRLHVLVRKVDGMFGRFCGLVCAGCVVVAAAVGTLPRVVGQAVIPASTLLVSGCILEFEEAEIDTTNADGEDDGCPTGPPI